MNLLNHFINSEEEDGGYKINRYISFDIDVRKYSSVGMKHAPDKNILCIDLHLDEYLEQDGESSWHSRKSDRHILDFNLKEPDDIYGIACALSCILDNGMAKILDDFNPRKEPKE